MVIAFISSLLIIGWNAMTVDLGYFGSRRGSQVPRMMEQEDSKSVIPDDLVNYSHQLNCQLQSFHTNKK